MIFKSVTAFAMSRARRFGNEAAASTAYIRSNTSKVLGRRRTFRRASRLIAIGLGIHVIGCWAVATVWIIESGHAAGLGVWDLFDRFNAAMILISPLICYPYALLTRWTKAAMGPRHLAISMCALGWIAYAAPTLAIWITIKIRNSIKRRRERVGKFCHVCNYDLRASIGRCPECGTPCNDNREKKRGHH